MSNPVIFNRRLGKNELDLLFDVFKINEINRVQAVQFFRLEDSIAFLSSLGDEVIGGTIVYRDRTRLGMVLASIAIKERFRDLGAYTIIKSSLPFFRTVAIRDVDAIISGKQNDDRLKFPFSFELPSWTKQILEENSFVEEQNLCSCKIEIKKDEIRPDTEVRTDTVASIEGARALIWDTGTKAGLTNSVSWMSLNLAVNSKNLQTISEGDSTKLAYSLYKEKNAVIIGFVIASDDFVKDRAVIALSSAIKETQMKEIRFPLVGRGQMELVQDIANEVGGSLKSKSITLMRRRL